MEITKASPTQGSNQVGYIPVNSSADYKEGTDSTETQGPGDRFGIKYIIPLIKLLQDNLAFSAVLLNIIGYIIISSFGHMDTVGAYYRYVIFLLINIVLYRFLGKNKVEIDFKNVNWLLVIGILVLLCFVLIDHGIFVLVYNSVVNTISKE